VPSGKPRQKDIGPENIDGEHGFNGHTAFCPHRRSDTFVGLKLLFGACHGYRFKGMLNAAKGVKEQLHLLFNGSNNEVTFGCSNKKRLTLFCA
jgi:hypothetical protein